MMIVTLIVIILIALAIFWCYKHQAKITKFLQSSHWGSNLLSWFHSTVFDFKMENPDRVPKQITWAFVGIVIVIGIVAVLISGGNQ